MASKCSLTNSGKGLGTFQYSFPWPCHRCTFYVNKTKQPTHPYGVFSWKISNSIYKVMCRVKTVSVAWANFCQHIPLAGYANELQATSQREGPLLLETPQRNCNPINLNGAQKQLPCKWPSYSQSVTARDIIINCPNVQQRSLSKASWNSSNTSRPQRLNVRVIFGCV